MAGRYLTKSRFKTGLECPTKLYFLDRPEYGNKKDDDSFLAALAEGGFQVGELAKLYYPGGTEITSRKHDEAAAQTAELLKQDKVIIYEAAFKHENLFVRVDILVKDGTNIELIEVKAKSFDPRKDGEFFGKKGNLSSSWGPYLMDVAFQTYVLNRAYPRFKVRSYLKLADKSAETTVDGLNQCFLLIKDGDRTAAKTKAGVDSNSVGDKILVKVDVTETVRTIWNLDFDGKNFDQLVADLSELAETGKWHPPTTGNDCKKCEFRIDAKAKASGLQSGFDKCWSETRKLKAADLEKPFVFDVWDMRRGEKLISLGKYLMNQLTEEDIEPKESVEGLSRTQRQWLQVQLTQQNVKEPFIDFDGLAHEMESWTYPLNFIDFETMMTAIPFQKGRRPYEQSAFQFSHHIVTADGRVTHAKEYINIKRGHFPNFDFLRALKETLETNEGTIFRYATHENTVLRQIRVQLENSSEVDRDVLIRFIDTITEWDDGDIRREGPRNMIDLCDLVKKYYFHPRMGGSNSIKKVLPAIIHHSRYLQTRYGLPIYGTTELPSHNFQKWHWIEKDENGNPSDPYKRLGALFEDLTKEEIETYYKNDELADGGAAMTAYARMQFTEMSDKEFETLRKALLRYCELDTLAMVMIFEYWREELKAHGAGKKTKRKLA